MTEYEKCMQDCYEQNKKLVLEYAEHRAELTESIRSLVENSRFSDSKTIRSHNLDLLCDIKKRLVALETKYETLIEESFEKWKNLK